MFKLSKYVDYGGGGTQVGAALGIVGALLFGASALASVETSLRSISLGAPISDPLHNHRLDEAVPILTTRPDANLSGASLRRSSKTNGERSAGAGPQGKRASFAGPEAPATVDLVAAPHVSHESIEACLDKAAIYHGVDPNLLHAIAVVESGLNPQAMNTANANGTRDIGLMQINSSWLPQLARWNIREQDLFDPCISAYVGAWILADNIARLGPVWRAVGAYNARSPERQLRYVQRVQRQLGKRLSRDAASRQ